MKIERVQLAYRGRKQKLQHEEKEKLASQKKYETGMSSWLFKVKLKELTYDDQAMGTNLI